MSPSLCVVSRFFRHERWHFIIFSFKFCKFRIQLHTIISESLRALQDGNIFVHCWARGCTQRAEIVVVSCPSGSDTSDTKNHSQTLWPLHFWCFAQWYFVTRPFDYNSLGDLPSRSVSYRLIENREISNIDIFSDIMTTAVTKFCIKACFGQTLWSITVSETFIQVHGHNGWWKISNNLKIGIF